MASALKFASVLSAAARRTEWRRGYQHVGLRIRTLFARRSTTDATTAFNIAYGTPVALVNASNRTRYQRCYRHRASPSMEYTVITDSAHDGRWRERSTDSRVKVGKVSS